MNESEIREVEIPDSLIKTINPVQFYGPQNDATNSRDFRPSVFVFKNDEDETKDTVDPTTTEDGHGNTHSNPHTVPHPSESQIKSDEQLSLDDVNSENEEKTTEETAKKSPGIAAPQREQPDPE